MIEFPCRCGYRFSLPESQAGTVFQCPRCGKLLDVPTLSDLPFLNTDGTYKEIPLKESPGPRADILGALRSGPGVASDEYDLRASPEEIANAGTEQRPLEDLSGTERGAPKYDPETGQLIRPMAMKDTGPVPAIPLRRRTLVYAAGLQSMSLGQAAVRLMMAGNSLVVFLIFAAEVFAHVAASTVMAFTTLVFTSIVMAHYGTVIDETGPTGNDSLPRPLRDLGFRDDIWNPLQSVALAILICFLPFFLARADIFSPHLFGRLFCLLPMNQFWPKPVEDPGVRFLISIGLLGLGTFVYPAALLTTTTSGTFLNLRPDRLLGVIAACGPRYLVLVASGGVAVALYTWNVFGASVLAGNLGPKGSNVLAFLEGPVAFFPLLALGTYAAHLFCFHLGLTYRDFHERFPWVMQRHIPQRDRERVEQIRAAAAAQRTPPADHPASTPPRRGEIR